MTISYNSKVTKPVLIKCYVKPPGAVQTNNSSNTSGHMANMAAMPIYGKNRHKSSSEAIERWS